MVLGIVLVMTVAGGFYYVSEKGKAIKQIQTIADRTSERISNSLIYPLWNFSNEEIEKTISLEIANENIIGIILSDQNNAFLMGKIKDDQGSIVNYHPSVNYDAKLKKSMLVVKKKIFKNVEPLGEVKIFFTGQYLNQYLRELIIRVVLLTIILSIFIVAVIFLSLKKIILNPLIVLQNAVQRLNAAITGEGDKNYRVMIGTGDEIDILGKHFNAMADGLALSQHQLQQTLGWLRTLTDTTPDAVISIDLNSRIIDVNETCTKMFGYTYDEFSGRKINDLGAKTASQDIILENISHAMQGDSVDFEWTTRRKNNELFPVAVRFRLMKFGDERSILAVITDITERKKAEEALKKSEEKYRNIFENAVEGFFQSTPGGQLVNVNPALSSTYGYDSPEEMIAAVKDAAHQLYVNPDEREQYKHLLEKDGFAKNYEHQAYRKDGSKIWVSRSARVVHDDAGNILYHEGTVTDITSLKAAEEAIRKEKEKLLIASENARAIVNATIDSIYLTDTNGVILAINEAGLARLDLDPDKAVGASVFDDVPFYIQQRRKLRLDTVISTKKPLYFEGKFRGKWYDTCLYPVITEGKVTGLVVYGRDITERKKAEEALKKSEGMYRNIFESAVGGFFQSTPEGRFIKVNRALARTYGYDSPEEIIMAVTDVAHQLYVNPDEREQYKNLLEKDGFVKNYEHQAYRKDGSKIWVSRSARVVSDVAGNMLYHEGTVTDITSLKAAEEALRVEKEKLLIASENARAIVNATTDAIYLFNTDGVVLAINEAGAERLGIDFSMAIGANVFEGVSSDVEQGRRSRVGQVIITKKPVYYEADRRNRWYDTCLYPVINYGKVTGIVLYGRDITERKLAEESLKEEREKFRIILENAPMGMAMIGKDNAFKYINPKFKELFGYDLEDIPDGRTWFRKAFPDPDYRHEVISTWLSRNQDSKGRVPREIPKVFNTTCKDGTIKIVNFLAVTLEAGEHIMTCEDVTELKEAEERLLNERYRFKSLTESAPFGMVLIDNMGAFKYINPKFKELFGYDPEDIPDGRTWFMKAFPDPEYRHMAKTAWVDDIKNMGSGAAVRRWIFDVQCKDGSVKTVSFVPVQLREGEYVMTGEDITESRRAEEELKKHHEHLEELVGERTLELKAANKELEAFSYSVSHDLRAPLRAIDGFSRILSDDHAAQLTQEAQRYLRLVREGAQQMGKLIEDLLAFSRLSRQPLSKQTVAPASIVHQMLEQLRYMQEGRRVEISIGELPVCQSDPSLLKVVYMNLISNALKFTGKRDRALIEIGCQDENGEHVYYVKDNGAGFNMKYVEKLFGVFQRLHHANEFEGTGVGLASVQRIIHRHGGRIWVASEVDKGTTFYFTLEKGGKVS